MTSESDDIDQMLSKLNFSEELKMLRKIILSTGLIETVKWGAPIYTYEGRNVIGITGFKAHFGLWFFQGALLTDPKKKLINAQEGKTKALRQWRMVSKADIDKPVLIAYIKEAIGNEINGARIGSQKPIKKSPALPSELKSVLDSSKKLKAAFEKLTPGKQKEYALYISDAKQAQTKTSRIQKIKPMILAGIGLNDKYNKK